MAGALGACFADAGHQLMIGARNPEAAASLARTIGNSATHGDIAEAARYGEAVLLAVNRDRVWQMSPPLFDGRPIAVPHCGDDDAAKGQVRRLIEDIGCRPLDLGGLEEARHIEYLAAIVIGLLLEGADPTTVFNLVDAA